MTSVGGRRSKEVEMGIGMKEGLGLEQERLRE